MCLWVFLVAEGTLLKPLSVCLSQMCSKSVNKTSTEARLAPGSCTVEYKQLYMYTLYSGVKTGGHMQTECTILFSLAKTHLSVQMYLACYRNRVAILLHN